MSESWFFTYCAIFIEVFQIYFIFPTCEMKMLQSDQTNSTGIATIKIKGGLWLTVSFPSGNLRLSVPYCRTVYT